MYLCHLVHNNAVNHKIMFQVTRDCVKAHRVMKDLNRSIRQLDNYN